MKAINLSSEPYNFSTILKCNIHKTVNVHFDAEISGYITESIENIMRITDSSEDIIIYAGEEGESKSIFRGKVRNLKIQAEGNLKLLTINAESNSSCLDENKHIRTFQNPNFTYRDIVNFIVKKNENTSVIYFAGKKEIVKELLVQYEESDWMFLKRLAARVNTVLVPDCTNNSKCFYFGIPRKKGKANIDSENMEVFVNCSHNALGRNIVEYHITTREIWDLCTPIIIQGVEVLVYDIQGSLIGGEMVWKYCLRKEKDFRPEEAFNKNIIGASLFGKVIDTKKDMVKVSLDCEDDYSGDEGIWYQFATIYTSSDGNGWYFMPDHGERVRLCFPDEKEKNAYVANSAYMQDVPGEKNNPEIKFIRTAQGKEIRFAPDYILVTNNKGMSIRLDDETGIEIKSSKNIELDSIDGMILSSEGKLKIKSSGGILLNQNENSIIVREGVFVNGTRVEFR